MARYGCTITVAAGKIPGSQSQFSWVITEDNFPPTAIDGGAQSILNGGGNLRCYTDSTKLIQLPIEIPAGSFVTGVSPSIVVWGLSGTLNVGGTVYIEADTVATAQPAPSNIYGSEKVWVNNVSTYHGNSLTDSAGNNNLTAYNSPSVDVAGRIGGAFEFTASSSQYMDASTITGLSGVDATFIAWIKLKTDTGAGQGIISLRDDPANTASTYTQQRLTVQDNVTGNPVRSQFRGDSGVNVTADTISATIGSWSMVSASFDTSVEVNTYVDGSNKITGTSATQSANLQHIYIGAWQAQSSSIIQYSDVLMESIQIIDGKISDDHMTSISNNQSDPATFWTTGTWEDQDASITIIESTGTLNLSTQNPTIEFTGTITVEESTSTLNTTSQSPTITFTATLTIVESTQTISLTGFDPTIALTPPSTLVVVESTQSIDWTTQSPNITLSGTLTIEESTQTIDMLTRRPVIQLGIPTYTQIFTGIEKSYEFTGTIKSYGFTGIMAASQTFSGIEKAATFLGVKQ